MSRDNVPVVTKVMGVVQDPILYPQGTGWMAPGPMGQCFPIPDDDKLKAHMVKVAENKRCIWNMYNFDYKTQVRIV